MSAARSVTTTENQTSLQLRLHPAASCLGALDEKADLFGRETLAKLQSRDPRVWGQFCLEKMEPAALENGELLPLLKRVKETIQILLPKEVQVDDFLGALEPLSGKAIADLIALQIDTAPHPAKKELLAYANRIRERNLELTDERVEAAYSIGYFLVTYLQQSDALWDPFVEFVVELLPSHLDLGKWVLDLHRTKQEIELDEEQEQKIDEIKQIGQEAVAETRARCVYAREQAATFFEHVDADNQILHEKSRVLQLNIRYLIEERTRLNAQAQQEAELAVMRQKQVLSLLNRISSEVRK